MAGQIREFLRQQAEQRAESEFLAVLEQRFAVDYRLEPFRVDIAADGFATLGPQDAPVTIVEFSDFECPFCARVQPALQRAKREYGDRLRIVYRHYPLANIHANAQKAAEASLCAGEQGMFWEMHDLMFAEQATLSVPDLKDKAGRIGLDRPAFDACLDSGRHHETVRNDIRAGAVAGVSGTPALFVNGRPADRRGTLRVYRRHHRRRAGAPGRPLILRHREDDRRATRDDNGASVRKFNTAGPIDPEDHYHIPPLERIDLDEVLGMVSDKKYFVLHAPRQTGKTSALLALRDLLNSGQAGSWRCVYANVEAGQAARENVTEAMRAMLSEFALRASLTLGDDSLEGISRAAMDSAGPMGVLGLVLSRWAAADRSPLVLLIDEIDSLVGDTLLSVLRQVRAGYDRRPSDFPHSIILCGVRDVRDYRIHSSAENRMVLGGSAFNISRSRCGSATSRSRRYGRCLHSIRPRPGRRSRNGRWS